VSAGNVYRYFETKESLFAEVVPTSLARRLFALVRQKVRALAGERDERSLVSGAPWRVLSEELLVFCLENRLAVVVLLGRGRAQGTEHENVRERMVRELVTLALNYGESIQVDVQGRSAARFALDRIYRNFVEAMADALEHWEDEHTIREAVGHISGYHLAGMKAFFEGAVA
jgi:AcrR family transcriptional regulator